MSLNIRDLEQKLTDLYIKYDNLERDISELENERRQVGNTSRLREIDAELETLRERLETVDGDTRAKQHRWQLLCHERDRRKHQEHVRQCERSGDILGGRSAGRRLGGRSDGRSGGGSDGGSGGRSGGGSVRSSDGRAH